MQNYKQWLSGAVALSTLIFGAMNMTPMGSRGVGHASYDHYLSKHYKRIAALEAETGTYSHYNYFNDKSSDVIGQHNPRPLTLRGHSNTQFNSREMRNMRRDLERAMVGYEMRYNPDAVAGMHAAYECRVKNTNVNNALDRRCLKAFDTFRRKAQKSVEDSRMMVAKAEAPVMQPVIKPQPIIMNAPTAAPMKPVVKEHVVVPAQKTAPAMKPVHFEQKSHRMHSPAAASAPIAPMKPVMSQGDSAVSMPKTDNINTDFNPKDYIHPRFRDAQPVDAAPIKSYAPEQKLPQPVAKPTAPESSSFVEGEISKVPEPKLQKPMPKEMPQKADESFGIKRLSEAKVPEKPMQISLFSADSKVEDASKIDMSMFDKQKKITPHPRFLEASLESSTEFTANVDPNAPSIERYVVSFSQGGTKLSKAAEMEIQRIGTKIQSEKFSQVRFVGHSDKGGSDDLNRSLSFERAANVHDALENIINYAEIKKTTIDGLGDAKPVRAFKPEDDRNRRVVVELVR